MTRAQALVAQIGSVLILAALVGVIVRRRYAACYSFPVYLAAVLIPSALIALWPEHFYRKDFWLLKETLHTILRFAIALELAVRTFRYFPRAQETARRVLFTVLSVTCVVALAVPTAGGDYTTVVGRVLPRVLNGTIWLFTTIAVLILWYRLPVDPFHKAILIGFVPYLLVFTVAMNALDAFGWRLREHLNYAPALAYVALTAYWTYAAWRPSTAPDQPGSRGSDGARLLPDE